MEHVAEVVRRSRWILRALEWNDTRARYPNLWHEGMPCHVFAGARAAGRLRLGDLVAVFYPASSLHTARSERFVGLSRVIGLRMAVSSGSAWIDLSTEHRFDTPLAPSRQPPRVLLCCDPGWPAADVALFREVFDAAVAAGWAPDPEDRVETRTPESEPPIRQDDRPEPAPLPRPAARAGTRVFAGADYSGDMRDSRYGTWLALVELDGARLRVTRVEPTGRHGLEARLRNPDRQLMTAEAIGLDFPFGLPIGFAERLLGGPFPEDGWWGLARRLEKMTRPDFLVALQDYREAHGEPKRWTDEHARAFSPLHRVNPDLGPMTYHGVRMIAEDRSRYAIRPFESALGRRLLEVYPGALARTLRADGAVDEGRCGALLAALARLDWLPVEVTGAERGACLARRDALDAVLAARMAAAAVLTGEADRIPTELAPENADRVRVEGWIYGLP